MSWPVSQDYNESIQTPAQCFLDPDLKRGEAVTNSMGMPELCSGNFADVYAVVSGQRKWAVKCFTRQIPGLKERYAEISKYLAQVRLPFMVAFSYLDQGIRVHNQWYPVLKMEWVEGQPLNVLVAEQVGNPAVLQMLCKLWAKMASTLRGANLAHGDLQHGNVLLVPGAKAGIVSLKLVDYDGMCVPSLEMLKATEVGHPAYQHPQRLREGTYGLKIDSFSNLAIYTAIRALVGGGPKLWERYDNGDNLLFTEADFANPRASAVFQDLVKLPDPEVKKLVQALSVACHKPVEQTPLLDDLIPSEQVTTSPSRKSGVIAGTAPTKDGVNWSAVVASKKKQNKSGRGYLLPIGALVAVAVVVLAVLGFLAVKRSKREEPIEHAALNASTSVLPPTISKASVPIRKDETKAEPKRERTTRASKADPNPEPKKEEPKAEPKTEPKPEPKKDDSTPEPKKPEPKIEPKGEPKPEPKKGDAETRKEAPIPVLEGNESALSMALSADGKTLAASVVGMDGFAIKLWDMTSGKNIATFQGDMAPINSVVFNQKGGTLASADVQGKIKVWDIASGKNIATIQANLIPIPMPIALSPDGKTLASVNADATLKLWEVASGKNTATQQAFGPPFSSVAYSPDGKTLATGSLTGATLLWNVATKKTVASLQGHGGPVYCIAFSADGKTLATGSEDKTAKIWNIAARKNTATCSGHTEKVVSVEFSKDRGTLVSGVIAPFRVFFEEKRGLVRTNLGQVPVNGA